MERLGPMDIFAHALWNGAAARGARGLTGLPVRAWQAAVWGVVPDLFAFTIPFVTMLYARFSGVAPRAAHDHSGPLMQLAWTLYQYSHSLFIFAGVFGLAWALRRSPALAMLGWVVHILIDIPAHSLRFFPTPFLWPLSNYHYNGISWGTRWFMIANYSGIGAAWAIIGVRAVRRRWFAGRRRCVSTEAA